jgi:hypothetical protein
MKETVKTDNLTTIYNETIPYHKTTQFSWTLNSEWLTVKEHDEFESILTSKYLLLYNTKTWQGYYVNATDTNWTFRNHTNTKKPFNLTINLSEIRKSNIVL